MVVSAANSFEKLTLVRFVSGRYIGIHFRQNIDIFAPWQRNQWFGFQAVFWNMRRQFLVDVDRGRHSDVFETVSTNSAFRFVYPEGDLIKKSWSKNQKYPLKVKRSHSLSITRDLGEVMTSSLAHRVLRATVETIFIRPTFIIDLT